MALSQDGKRALSVVRGPTTPELSTRTLGSIIREQSERHGGRVAFKAPWQSTELTYRDLEDRSKVMAKALLHVGLRHGKCVGVMAGNCYQYIEIFLGAARIGCPVVAINNTFSPHELQTAVSHSNCRLLFMASHIGKRSLKDHARKLLDSSLPNTELKNMVIIGESIPSGRDIECHTYSSFSGDGKHLDIDDDILDQFESKVAPSDVLNLQFTSGTTGLPKAACLTHINLINNARFVGNAMRLTEEDIKTIEAVVKERATALLGVPTMFIAELEALAKTSLKIDTVRIGLAAGSCVPPVLMESLRKNMNIQGMLIAYGMTETSPVTFITSWDDPPKKLFDSIGRVLPHTGAKVVDIDGNILPVGVRGELCTSGFALQKGYWKDEERTREAMVEDHDGIVWMHTGDEAFIDSEGYGHITGRIKDIIIRGGENLSPAEIENRLLAHPAIGECCVVGLADPKYGEVVSCFLKPSDDLGTRIPHHEVRSWVKESLGHVKAPQHIFWRGAGRRTDRSVRGGRHKRASHGTTEGALEKYSWPAVSPIIETVIEVRVGCLFAVAFASRTSVTSYYLFIGSAMSVRIIEVGPRDGLQNIATTVPTATKLELIQRLQKDGIKNIEISSVVSPKAVPQLADCEQILSSSLVQQGLKVTSRVRLSVLIPNTKGLEIAVKHGVRHIAVFVSATEGFSKANINCTVDEGLQRAGNVAAAAISKGLRVRGYVSCIFSDPYDGPSTPSSVLRATKRLIDAGCYEVSIGDTLGVGTAGEVRKILQYLKQHGVDLGMIACHFHDTYGQALANVWEAYQLGIKTFDSSVGGLGGCPFAPGAKGNLATEDVVYMFEKSGIDTGVNLAGLVETGLWISRQLRQAHGSRAGSALCHKQLVTNPQATKKHEQPTALAWELVQETEYVMLFRSGANAKILLNKPRNGNALTLPMISCIREAFEYFTGDDSVSRIVISAKGKYFCTGMDLKSKDSAVGSGADGSKATFESLTQLFNLIDHSDKVTIACVNGPAFGGGIGLAFVCDIRLCISSSVFVLSEVKLGLCPAVISQYVIREWGVPLSRAAMLMARPVTAQELRSAGAVSTICENTGALESALESLLVNLRHSSPRGSRMSKELVRLGWSSAGSSKQKEAIAKLFQEMMGSGSESTFGVREFQAKRKVDWDLQQKTKCSGERPRCINCRRANRSCQYEAYSVTVTATAPSVNPPTGLQGLTNDLDLLNRITTIESQLARLSEKQSENPRRRRLSDDDQIYSLSPARPLNAIAREGSMGRKRRASEALVHDSTSADATVPSFNSLPPDSVIQTLIDAYFLHAHNQPYAYFQEATFRHNLACDLLPKCLVFAVLASALRFADDDFFRDSRQEAMEAYAREAWLSVLSDHLTVENSSNLHVVQTTTILAVIDFTAGRISSGWLKIGLAVRIAQDLQLMREPNSALPAIEQEERRRTFWSVYLLDKLVSCGKARPPAVSEEDCHLQLPCDEQTIRAGLWKETATLHQLLGWNTDTSGSCSNFALAILVASAFGRCARYVLHGRETDEVLPWDSRSEFTAISSFLLLVEQRLHIDELTIGDMIATNKTPDSRVDHSAIGHAIFARVLFYLCHCLLNHPFLLRIRLQRLEAKAPASFLLRTFAASCDNALKLVGFLDEAEKGGCQIGASFYAYATCVAGGILSLTFHVEEAAGKPPRSEVLEGRQKSFRILKHMGSFWNHASKMHQQLLAFDTNGRVFSNVLDPQSALEIEPAVEAALWSMVDYSELASASKEKDSVSITPVPAETPSPAYLGFDMEVAAAFDMFNAPANDVMYGTNTAVGAYDIDPF
ncbi:hypothetical protein G7046_g2582 [Stylonectria norvegica]|nr:hypothetical protein G7046_g2582 [Stylonectria norvegica]